MGWIVGVVVVAILIAVALVMAKRGQAAAQALAESRGWRYEKTGPETFRLRGREASGEWVATYGRGSGTDGGRVLAFEFALSTAGEAALIPRALHGMIRMGVGGAVARGLNALPGAKAGVVMDGPEQTVDWVRHPGFARAYALVGDATALRPALNEDAAERLMGYSMPLVPTVIAKHGRCRATLNVQSTPQALDALPAFVDLGRAMMAAPRCA